MKIIHYINQFFAGIGGEEKADQEPFIKDELIGPAVALNAMVKPNGGEVTHTIVCGDNFMGSKTEEAVETILGFLRDKEFDLFVAGPAFQAGRYGFACGTICKAVEKEFGVPVLTSMHVENPGVEMFHKDMPIFIGGKSAAKMRADVQFIADYINKDLTGAPHTGAVAEHFFPRGVRHQAWVEGMPCAARRGVDMLLKKLHGEPYQTELIIPAKDLVPIAPAIKDLEDARIALCTTGGIVPVDNPDHIQSASATRWGRYDMTGMDRLESGVFKTIHAGFDPAAANADPNVIVPLDAMRAYEKEGKYGSLHPYFYSTVGTGTTEAEARRMALEIIPLLKQDNVNAIIMTST